MLKLDNLLGFGAVETTTKSVTVQYYASTTHEKYPVIYRTYMKLLIGNQNNILQHA